MTAVGEFAGNWIYRSFRNNPEFHAPPDDVVLATADLELEEKGASGLSAGLKAGDIAAGLSVAGSKITGKLTMHNGFSIHLNVSGRVESGEPPTIRFRATGAEGTPTAGWIYDYVGYLCLSWPEGVEQRPAIVGTVIRTVAHKMHGGGEGTSPAGATLSFVAVSRDHPAG